MSAQPANTEISIFRTVRSQRNPLRHETVAALIKRLRPLVMSVPGMEILAGVLTRDTANKDFSPYCGQAAAGASGAAARGFPVVYGLQPLVSFSQAATTLPFADFPFVIGQDAFITNVASALPTADLHKDLRQVAVADGYNNTTINH